MLKIMCCSNIVFHVLLSFPNLWANFSFTKNMCNKSRKVVVKFPFYTMAYKYLISMNDKNTKWRKHNKEKSIDMYIWRFQITLATKVMSLVMKMMEKSYKYLNKQSLTIFSNLCKRILEHNSMIKELPHILRDIII